MRKLDQPSPTESPLRFEFDPEPAPETLTALGGIPLRVQAFRALGLPASVKRHVQVKQRQRGYDEASLVGSFVILNAVGGECLEDFDRLGVGETTSATDCARGSLLRKIYFIVQSRVQIAGW